MLALQGSARCLWAREAPVRPRVGSQAPPSSLVLSFPGPGKLTSPFGKMEFAGKQELFFLYHARGRQLGEGQPGPAGILFGVSGPGVPVTTSRSRLLF